jgi:hypothetical protein
MKSSTVTDGEQRIVAATQQARIRALHVDRHSPRGFLVGWNARMKCRYRQPDFCIRIQK